jgi:two-component system NtrC family sensor kinase
MKLSIRRKMILAFAVFILGGSLIWYLNYYNHNLLNRKLQILEKKETLFNTVLEARRYEKNYFLYMDQTNLQDAIAYIEQAEKILIDIIETYGKYTLDKNLEANLNDLRRYARSLKELLDFYKGGESPRVNELFFRKFSQHQLEIRELGKTITGNMETMLIRERQYVNRLIEKSNLYHFMALGGILALSLLTILFFTFSVNRPLKAIEDAIHKIVVGDYQNIPHISTGDEFESLVTSLNNMISELNRRSEQLLQSRKLASLGTLTSGVAHELNNPLNNISTSVQILIEELDEGDLAYQKELLRETEKQIDRARDIVRALLEFSRERSFSLKRVRFKDLVADTLKLIKGELPASVQLNVEVSEDSEGVMDRRRIQQVLLNLIINGVQAMKEGGVLSIRTCGQNSNKEICFQVQDTGKGIPAEELPKIFDPFFTTKEIGEGTGLGLSITHSIIEQHGGRIEVESKPGEGTIFTVCLPTHPQKPKEKDAISLS